MANKQYTMEDYHTYISLNSIAEELFTQSSADHEQIQYLSPQQMQQIAEELYKLPLLKDILIDVLLLLLNFFLQLKQYYRQIK